MTDLRATTLTRPASRDEADEADKWRDRAECVKYDPEIWFTDVTAEARRICDGCPVKAICLKDAIDERDFYGVRGGRTGKQRKFLARGQQPLAPGVAAANQARRDQSAQRAAQIAELALSGKVAKEIAAELGFTVENVRDHLSSLRLRGVIPDEAGRVVRTIKHGTRGGHYAHRFRGEKPCTPCHAAMLEYERVRRARNRELARAEATS